MSEEVALAAADLATVAQLRAHVKALSLQIGEQHTTIGYQDAMLDQLRQALRPFATWARLALDRAGGRDSPLRDRDIVFKLDDVAITVGDLRRAAEASNEQQKARNE